MNHTHRTVIFLAITLLSSFFSFSNAQNEERAKARQIHREALSQNTMQLDSLKNAVAALQHELGENVERIEALTEKIEDNTFFDWKAWTAWAVGILALAVAWITYRAQSKTEGNTKKLSQQAQHDLLVDLIRHLYRNYVITYTMRTKMEEIDYRGYPSEEHFLKLKIPLENLHLDAFYGEDAEYKAMHTLYLNFRNYNEEVDVAMSHMTNPSLATATKKEDFETLEFKASYLTGRIIDVMAAIWGDASGDTRLCQKAIQEACVSNARNNQPVDNCGNFTPLGAEQFRQTQYSRIFTTDEQMHQFVESFNEDVKNERMLNQRGAQKVRILKLQ